MSDQIVGQLLQQIEDLNAQLHHSHREIQNLKRDKISLKDRNQNLIKRVAILEQSKPTKYNINDMGNKQQEEHTNNQQILPWPFLNKMSLDGQEQINDFQLPLQQDNSPDKDIAINSVNRVIPSAPSQIRSDIESIPPQQQQPVKFQSHYTNQQNPVQEEKIQQYRYQSNSQLVKLQTKDLVEFHPIDNDDNRAKIVIKFAEMRSCWQDVSIVGQFNQWKPVQMQWCEKQSCFRVQFIVQCGFKYRFSFRVNGQLMTDSKIETSLNAIGTLTNQVYAPKLGKNINLFSQPALSKVQSYIHPNNKDNFLFKKMLQEFKKQKSQTLSQKEDEKTGGNQIETAIKQGGTQEEKDKHEEYQDINDQDQSQGSSDFQVSQPIPHQSSHHINQRGEKLVQQDQEFIASIQTNDLPKAFQSAEIVRSKSKLNYEELQNTRKKIKQDIKLQPQLEDLQFREDLFKAQLAVMERQILKLIKERWAFSIQETPRMHVVQGYRIFTGDIVLKRIYDQHGIKLSDTHPKLKFKKDMEFLNQFYFLSEQQKQQHINSAIESETTLQIKYKIQGTTPQNSECLPVQIYPSHIPLHQYNIIFNNYSRKITQIVSNLDGPVNFKAIEIDSQCGFISNSEMEIYTTNYAEDILNVFHIHINDMSDNVPIQVVTLQQGDKIQDFFQFGVDATGTLLRYKILVKNMKIFMILYNTGSNIEEINFKQIKIQPGKMTGVKDLPLIIKIERLPIGMLACADKAKMQKLIINPNDSKAKYSNIADCRMRYPEGLIGDIDVSIISEDGMSLVIKQSFVSICVCQCTEKLEDMQIALMESLFEMKEQNEKSALSKVIDGLQAAIKKYEASKNNKNKSLEEAQEIYQMLTEGEAQLNGLLGDVDLSGKEEEEKRLKQLDKIASDSLRRIAAELRMLKLRKQSHDQ